MDNQGSERKNWLKRQPCIIRWGISGWMLQGFANISGAILAVPVTAVSIKVNALIRQARRGEGEEGEEKEGGVSGEAAQSPPSLDTA